MFCRKCGNEIPDDSEFCPKCGIKIEVIDDNGKTPHEVKAVSKAVQARSQNPASTVFLEKEQRLKELGISICKTCGKPIPTGNVFCPVCGTNLPKEEVLQGEKTAEKSINRRSKKKALFISLGAAAAVFMAIFISVQVNRYKEAHHEFESYFDEESDCYSIKKYLGDDKDVVIPDTINRKPVYFIENKAFSRSNIKSVTFGKNVRVIGDSAFADCDQLESVTFTDVEKTQFETCYIGDEAFIDCDKLNSVKLPNYDVNISYGAFFDCDNLSNINLERALIIEDNAFASCENMYGVNLSYTKKIGDNAFGHCSSLEQISVNTISIGKKAFRDCTLLKSADIREMCIPSNCFENCTSLESVKIRSKENGFIESSAFKGCKNLSKITIKDKEYTCPKDLKSENGIEVDDTAFEGCSLFKDPAPQPKPEPSPETPTPSTRSKFSDFTLAELSEMTYSEFISIFGRPEYCRFGSAYYDGAEVGISGNSIDGNYGVLNYIIVNGDKNQKVFNDVTLGENLDYYDSKLSFNAYDALEIEYGIQGIGGWCTLPVLYTTLSGKEYKVEYRFESGSLTCYAAKITFLLE